MSSRKNERISEIDLHVGARIRERRVLLGLTQQRLAELIGVSYQQTHKYECGVNRISVTRLFQMAKVLGVPMSYFLDGLGQEEPRTITTRERMAMEMVRNVSGISNERCFEALSRLARVLADERC